MKKLSIKMVPIIVTFIVLVSATVTIIFKPSLERKCGSMLAEGSSKIGGNFELTDTNGQKVSSKNFLKDPALVYFGYSYCPDVCPYDLQRNVTAVDILAEQGTETLPIFITIDPQRDTPERLKEFSYFIHPKLLALTGSQAEIKQVMHLFKVFGQKSNDDALDNDYLMDHSAFTYLIDPSGSFIQYFSRKVSAEKMAETVSCYVAP